MPDKQSILQKPIRRVSYVQLTTPITGIVLSDSWLKLALDETNFTIQALGGFTFDDANDRFYWDASGDFNDALQVTFLGAAGIKATASIGGGVTITLGLFIDGVLALETPLSFDVIDRIQSYVANSPLLDASNIDLLQSGSYYEFFAKAGTSETPTISLDYFNTTIQGI